jgi:hypothetical protein
VSTKKKKNLIFFNSIITAMFFSEDSISFIMDKYNKLRYK